MAPSSFLSFTNPKQVVIAQWLAWQFATGVVLGSNPGNEINYPPASEASREVY